MTGKNFSLLLLPERAKYGSQNTRDSCFPHRRLFNFRILKIKRIGQSLKADILHEKLDFRRKRIMWKIAWHKAKKTKKTIKCNCDSFQKSPISTLPDRKSAIEDIQLLTFFYTSQLLFSFSFSVQMLYIWCFMSERKVVLFNVNTLRNSSKY